MLPIRMVLCVNLLLLLFSVSRSEKFQVHGPAAPVVVSPSEDSVLPCYLSPDINAEDLQIRWSFEGSAAPVCLYQNRRYHSDTQNPDYRGRTELFLEQLPRGNVSLKLTDVKLSDHGQYKCLVESVKHYGDTLIDLVVRTVSVSLHSPGGGQTQLLCRSEGWFPSPAVIWTDRDGHDVTSLSSTTVERDSQGHLSVSNYIPVQQESNIFSCLVRSTQPKGDWESQIHISNFFPGPSGWMVALCVTAAVIVVASVLLVIQWKRMDNLDTLLESELCYINALNGIPLIKAEIDAVKQAPLLKSQWQLLCSAAADVTLDPDTARYFTLSENGKRVRSAEVTKLPNSPLRFNSCVLSREGFTSGRHYWDVEVNDRWIIGVTRASAERKGLIIISPCWGYWCLYSDSSAFFALTDPETRLPLNLQPRRVGVCVDIEEKKVSFYTVESRTHIYTFTDMEFSELDKIYPVFWTHDKFNDLVLQPPSRSEDETHPLLISTG
ncbi:butyrophilin subfamily 2 member A2-like isoform X2 [Lepisosteus oculatus]|uniref:butyrophilin subfamily 2 member A2-like isoform X2 n=1 Tax=Lepisosteus oculatus TaxID=7918 RepID=UPI003718145E